MPAVVGEEGLRKARRAWLRPAAVVLLLVALFVLARLGGLPERLDEAEVRAALARLGAWAPAAVLAAFALRPLLLLPITPFWIAAGVLFGWVEGAALATAGTSVGAALGYWIARLTGRGLAERGRSRARRLPALEAADGFRTVLALQLTPVMPHDLINALAGVSRMSYPAFALASLLGTIPIIALYTYVGRAVWEIPSPPFWIAVGALTCLTAVMLAWNRRLARARRARADQPGGAS